MYYRLQSLLKIILISFVIVPIIILINYVFVRHEKCPSCPTSTQLIQSIISSNDLSDTEDEKTAVDDTSILCLDLAHRIDSERYYPQSPVIFPPTFNDTKTFRFPYRYSHWKSSSIIPRAISHCEHTLVMHLLTIIDRICRHHKITYFMSAGTLLGSIRHHDIIPWNDDVDIMVPYEQRELFTDAFKQIKNTLIGLVLHGGKTPEQEYYKLFYINTPTAGEFEWHFPFVDIFFYEQNQTHLGRSLNSDKIFQTRYIFPLILRPLGYLWLPAPRKPKRLFRFDPFDECKTHYWDHRNENGQEEIAVECDRLKDIYPFVEPNKKKRWIEILKINNTIIHTVVFTL
ncbi:unnamed protein product [Adineta steineri]|uniref:LicD/FKTN/FKRP nucleotidyltransferase domain-containing protein n=1 Tax=Adineta steineri TaxID=433720 RepID=A0A814EYS2_9BILA|nr:unnamed protein product [Adineta steineri]CAF1301671.1 unnamed protein product [Adineta steineri]CAF1378028.1 unnamed protein product [Adineta steineri]